MSIRRAYIDNLYGQLHYRYAGTNSDSPPLLCLHQTPKSGFDYDPILPDLGRDRVVLAPDTPGYGASDGPEAPILIADYAAAMIRFMDDLAPGRPFDVIGYHTGSLIATEMANRRPDRVRRIILVGLAAYDAETRKQKLDSIGRFPAPQPDISNITNLWNLLESMTDARVDLGWKQANLIECLRAGERLPWGFISVYKYDFLGNLAALRQPVLVMAPEDDLHAVTLAVAPTIPHGQIVEFKGAAHGFFKVEAARVCAVIRDFLGS
jgi:pimeloyl-ACP methyl ester carboxylesterase